MQPLPAQKAVADLDTLRHSRHALLDGFDEEGVQAVSRSRVLIIGAGGLGCPAATYLISSGVGHLHWIDGDSVEATNLARQPLFGPEDIGQPKVLAGARALQRLNPRSMIETTVAYADEALLDQAVPRADVVLDCTDQWAIRQMINAACVRHCVPLVSAAAIEWSGQLMVINPRHDDHACYACVFDPQLTPPAHACGAYGVLGPMVGAMGCLQAAEALKLIIPRLVNASAAQSLSMLDMRSFTWQQLRLSKNPNCSVCGNRSGLG